MGSLKVAVFQLCSGIGLLFFNRPGGTIKMLSEGYEVKVIQSDGILH
jgi:hypothetical protein